MKRVFLIFIFFIACWFLFPKADAQEITFQECCSNTNEFKVFANLLSWTVREAGADNWAEVIDTEGSPQNPNRVASLKEVPFPWDIGFRIGASCQSIYKLWDTKAYYTRFHTRGKDDLFGGPGTVHSTFLGNFYVNNPSGSGLSGSAYEKASIDWTIDYNIFDWHFGYNVCVSNRVNFHPYLGLKAGWIHQSIHSMWENPDIEGEGAFQVGTENLKNNFWGIGPEVGVESKWLLFTRQCHFVHLLADFSVALLYGHWSFSDVYQNDLGEQIIIGNQNMNSGAPAFKTFIGFGWEHAKEGRCRFSTKLGFEMQIWLDQLRYYSFTGGRLENQLTLQGGTLEFCFSF